MIFEQYEKRKWCDTQKREEVAAQFVVHISIAMFILGVMELREPSLRNKLEPMCYRAYQRDKSIVRPARKQRVCQF